MPVRPPKHGARSAAASKHERPRERPHQHLYDERWKRIRRAFLSANPLCIECEREGKLEPATVVDHVIAHRGDRRLFYDVANYAALCATHHNRKTAALDGGFGNATGSQ
ncbi:MAG: HNH endonuclease [Gammaproteobacteria bacterium]|nr:HNH endonuclease [Gammaproteobacteria bacterium]